MTRDEIVELISDYENGFIDDDELEAALSSLSLSDIVSLGL